MTENSSLAQHVLCAIAEKGPILVLFPTLVEEFFKFYSMLDHIRHDHQVRSITRLTIDEDGVQILVDQLRNKCGRDL